MWVRRLTETGSERQPLSIHVETGPPKFAGHGAATVRDTGDGSLFRPGENLPG